MPSTLDYVLFPFTVNGIRNICFDNNRLLGAGKMALVFAYSEALREGIVKESTLVISIFSSLTFASLGFSNLGEWYMYGNKKIGAVGISQTAIGSLIMYYTISHFMLVSDPTRIKIASLVVPFLSSAVSETGRCVCKAIDELVRSPEFRQRTPNWIHSFT